MAVAPVTPLVLELPAGLAPEDALSALHTLPGLVFLDSSGPDDDRGRYSYLTADPFLTLSSRGQTCHIMTRDGVRTAAGDPFAVLQDVLRQYPCGLMPPA